MLSFFIQLEYGDIRNNFQNLEFQTEDVKNSIRPSLLRSIDPLKQNRKMEDLMDRKTMDQLEASIHRFKLESSIRNKRSILPAIQQVLTLKQILTSIHVNAAHNDITAKFYTFFLHSFPTS